MLLDSDVAAIPKLAVAKPGNFLALPSSTPMPSCAGRSI
jgi:hypothetical protein